jgi:hypothetical protein
MPVQDPNLFITYAPLPKNRNLKYASKGANKTPLTLDYRSRWIPCNGTAAHDIVERAVRWWMESANGEYDYKCESAYFETPKSIDTKFPKQYHIRHFLRFQNPDDVLLFKLTV